MVSRAGTMTATRRTFGYFAQTGRWTLTPRQWRRTIKKSLRMHGKRTAGR